MSAKEKKNASQEAYFLLVYSSNPHFERYFKSLMKKLLTKIFLAMSLCGFLMSTTVSLSANQQAELVGQAAAAFKLPSHLGADISLEQYLGKKNVVLAFYPKNFTGG